MPLKKKAQKCRDCEYCQACSKNRCRLCRGSEKGKKHPQLTSCLTYEQYQKWKQKRDHEKITV